MKAANLIEGLQILAKSGAEFVDTAAEHDKLFAGSSNPLSSDDYNRMVALGWNRDEDGGGWFAWM